MLARRADPNLGAGGGESHRQEDRASGNLAHTGAQGGTVKPSSVCGVGEEQVFQPGWPRETW